MSQIQNLGINALSFQQGGAEKTDVGPGVQGEYQGQKVSQGSVNTSSLIADSMEEVTVLAQEHEADKKGLEERKGEKETGIKSMAFEMAEKLLRGTGGVDEDKLNEFVASVRKQGSPSASQLRDLAGKIFDDVTDQHAALLYLKEKLEQDGADPALLRAVKEAKAEIEGEHGPEIQAGYNVAQQAEAASKDGLGTPKEVRDLYRESILGFTSVNDAYDGVLKKYGSEKFMEATEFLIKSLGDDLKAPLPSRDMVMLKALNDDIDFIRMCRNTHNEFSRVINTMSKVFGLPKTADPHALMSEVLPMKDSKWVQVEKVLALPQRMGVQNDEQKIYCLRELQGLVRSFPDKMYNNAAEDRPRLRAVFDQAGDRAINEEKF